MLQSMATSAVSALVMAAMPNLAVGDVAPQFEAHDSEGKQVSLQALREHSRAVVLIFFPKAKTPGCTRELTQYVAQAQALEALGAALVAVSGDKAEAQEAFRKQLHAAFRFLPDPDGKLMKLFGTKYPLVTVSRRKTFVIDALGRIAHIEEGADAESLSGVRQAIEALPRS